MNCTLCTTAEADGYLCFGCTVATADRLAAMPGRYEELAEFLHPGSRRPELGRTRPAEAPLPIAEPVISLRGPGGIVGVLEDWHSALRAVRAGITGPGPTGSIAHRVRLASRGLALGLEWIATRWDMAGQFAEEIRQLERDVDAILDPEDPTERPQPYGPCPRMLGLETVCGALLLLRPDQGTIDCAWCGGTWPPARWLDLAEAQELRAAAQELTADAA
ncbi:hypothetical protein ACGF7W_19645 [Streptomyces sp. NPDC048219]|uniref:hypothetical protein n=1 Tax=Streptomyces sp. NPDC048219 TaxID=3365517 RepID=UPI00371C7E32